LEPEVNVLTVESINCRDSAPVRLWHM